MSLEHIDLYAKPPALTIEPAKHRYNNIEELNLNDELLELYQNTKEILDEIRMTGVDSVPLNQIAQVTNTLIMSLKEITKTQVDVYNVEMTKKMEGATIAALKLAPKEVQEAFYIEYTRLMQLWESIQTITYSE